MLKRRISKYKGVVFFSILKYIEIIITSFTTFILAKKLGPIQLGEAVPILLYITYANYLALGLNQVITKNYSRTSEEKKVSFITLNFQYLLVASVFNLVLAWQMLDREYATFAAVVSIFTIWRGFFSSYYRAVGRIRVLNINNVLFSLVLFVVIFFFVSKLSAYLHAWALVLLFAIIFYCLPDSLFFKKIFKNLNKIPSKQDIKFNFSEGIKLALTGIITTIFITFDRFIINKLEIPLEIKGSFQLADYIGMAIYMMATTIIFYFYPQWIQKIREDAFFSKKYLKNCIRLVLLSPFIILLIYLISLVLIPFLFPEYPDLLNIVVGVVFSKLAVVSISFVSLYYIGKDKEQKFLSKAIFPISVLFAFVFYAWVVKLDHYILVPILNGTVLFITSVYLMRELTKSNID